MFPLRSIIARMGQRRNRRSPTTLRVDQLEDRCVPTVTLGTHFSGLKFADTPGYVPPDTIAAAGTDHIVEMVNTDIAIYNKSDGSLVASEDLGVLFNTSDSLSDPGVTYDEQAGVFFIDVLDFQNDLLYYGRFSDTATGTNPLAAPNTVELNEGLDVTDGGGFAGLGTTGDYPRAGWNADVYTISLNMFDVLGNYDHVSVVTIPKADFQNPAQVDPFGLNDPNANNFTLAPATMHGAQSGADVMWFAEEAGYGNGSKIKVVKETGVLSSPTFTSYNIGVAAYLEPPTATQKGASTRLQTNDSRILNAEWRNDQLVAAQTVGLSTDSQSHARWYEFDTSGTTPALTQQGTVGKGSGSNSYFPAIAINANGDVGMSYMQSSANEYVSMYVTGATYSSTAFAMTLQAGVKAQAGQTTYNAFDGSPYRAGDFSGMSVDPATSGALANTFWGANEFTGTGGNWSTHVANFSLSASASNTKDVAVTNITLSQTSVVRGNTITVSVKVTNVGTATQSGIVVTLTDKPPTGGTKGAITPASTTISLTAGQSKTVTFTYKAKLTTTTGTHTLTGTATLTGDQDNSNNSLATTVTVKATAGGSGPVSGPKRGLHEDDISLPGQPPDKPVDKFELLADIYRLLLHQKNAHHVDD